MSFRLTVAFVSVLLASGSIAPVAAAPAEVRINAEAIAGSPYGVGRLTFDMPAERLPEPLGADGLGVSESSGRVLYPVVHTPMLGVMAKEALEATPLLTGGPVRQELRQLLREMLDQPPRTTIYFLFRGEGPLELTLQARSAHKVTVVPRVMPRFHRRWLEDWWALYTAPPRLLQRKPDYPPQVENYLKATLARRLDLKLPKEQQTDSPRELLKKEAGLLLGSESLLMALEQDRALGLHDLTLPADQPLPEAINPPPLEVPEPAADIQVEPIAARVPAECFYMRFGSFSNSLWLRDTLATWGGDLRNLWAARGLDYEMTKRMESQLAVKLTVLARLLGEAVVADVAVIGTDTFFREGAAYGLLIHARNNLALSAGIGQQWAERLQAGGATQQKLTLGGHTVAHLASADGSVRSYYAADGDFHFVTTSKRLMERFLETRSGKGALGPSQEFRHARTIMPLTRKDTVWIYLSDAFFRNLTSPQYRLETARRLQAQADIEVVQLAVLAAATEGKQSGTIERLVAGGVLPPDFGPRPDGSQVVLQGGEAFDSLRGRRGFFLPVPDVPVRGATRAEVTDYRKFAEFYQEHWQRMDPMIIGLKRQAQEGNRDQIVIDARFSPFAAKHFQFFSQWVGAADAMQMAAVPGDIARGELLMPKQRIFLGVRDFGPPQDLLGGGTPPRGRLRDLLVAYLGTTGELGLLSFLEGPIVLPPLRLGERETRLGALRQKTDQFTVFSLHPEVLQEVVPQLRLEPAARAAQLRVWIGDVSKARITPLVNNFAYTRTVETSLGNLRLMHALDQQLHVPPKNCQQAAEFLLGAKLICPLGGQYRYHESPEQPGHWTSTALESPRVATRGLGAPAPPGYVAPPLSWFRGLSLEATMTQKILSAHADLLMQQPPKKK